MKETSPTHALRDSSDALKSQLLFNTLFENLADEVHLWKLVRNDDGRILTWELEDANPVALKAWGKQKEDILGKPANEIFGYDATGQFMPIVEKIFTTGEPHKWIEHFEPTQQYLSMTTAPMGEYFLSTGEDVTEKIKAEEELRASEQKYRSLAESLQGVVIRYRRSAEGKDDILYINNQVEDLFGVPRDEALANVQLLWDRVHPADLEGFAISVDESARNLTVWEHDARLQMPDGEVKWVFMKGVPEKHADGSIVWNTFGLDITEAKKASESLERLNNHLEDVVSERTQELQKTSEELEVYRLAAEFSKSGVWNYNFEEGKFEWDDIMYELYGVKRNEHCDTYTAWISGIHPNDKDAVSQMLENALEQGEPFDAVFKIIHAETNETVHIRAKCKVEKDQQGRVTVVYGTNWDVTREMLLSVEREKALENLKETQSQLVLSEKMASLGLLTSGIAHEINNPLNYILGGYTAMQEHINSEDTLSKEELQEYLSWIKTGAERATGIVKSLNLFSRNSNKKNEPCDLHTIIDDCILVLQHLHKDRIEIIREYNASQATILGNSGRLHQVLINLLSNAMDAIEDDGQIRVCTESNESSVTILVEDSGCGIKPEDALKIFDPFFTTKSPGKGTGLGLSITKSIIEEHKGKLTFQTTPDQGTQFRIQLPL